MSQTSTHTVDRSAKNLVKAFFAVADQIDEAQRPAAILAGISLIAADAKMPSRLAEHDVARQPKAAKATRAKKAKAKGGKAGAVAADAPTPAEGANAAPDDAVTAMPRTAARRPQKAKPALRRAAAVEAGNGHAAAA